MSNPDIAAVPEVIERSPVRILNVVVLPAPANMPTLNETKLILSGLNWSNYNINYTINSEQSKALSMRNGQTDTIDSCL